LIEDPPDLECLRAQKYLVAEAESLATAHEELARSPLDLVLSDWKLPDGNGNEVLREVRREHPKDMSQPPRSGNTFQLPLEGLSWETHEHSCLRQALEPSPLARIEPVTLVRNEPPEDHAESK